MIEISTLTLGKVILSFVILIGVVRVVSSKTTSRARVLLALLFGGATWVGIYTVLGWVFQYLL